MTAIFVGLSIWFAMHTVRLRTLDPAPYLTSSNPDRRGTLSVPPAALFGSAAGVVFSLAEPEVSPIVATVTGFAIGWATFHLRTRAARDRRADRVLHELPTVADTLALHIRAGASVRAALASFAESGHGSIRDEIERALRDPEGLEPGLAAASEDSTHQESRRLFDLLAHSHRSGGRLADALADLARDQRAGLLAQLTAEGGRRALVTYGPILAFMIPVTLVFLMYPTLAGLSALSASP